MSNVQEYHGYSRDRQTEGSVQVEYRNSRIPCSPECDRDCTVLVLLCVRKLLVSLRVIWPQQCKKCSSKFFYLDIFELKDRNETRNGSFFFQGALFLKEPNSYLFPTLKMSHSQKVACWNLCD